MKYLMLAAMLLLTSGCAHVAEIIDNQSIETSKIGKTPGVRDNRIVTLDGPRRLVRSTYDEAGRWQLCAETQADAIAARSAKADLEITDRGKLGDSIQELLTVTNTRTELNDGIRQIFWQICNNRANGFISAETAERTFSEVVTASLLTLQLRSAADAAALAKAKADLVATTAKLKSYQDCVTKSEGDKAKIAACPT